MWFRIRVFLTNALSAGITFTHVLFKVCVERAYVT
jgi:hypothetical protein